MTSLSGKYAIVTGGSRGIGAAIAIEFAKRGAKGVAIGYAGNTAAAQKTVSEIEAHGATAVAIRSNLLDIDVGEQLVKAALAGLKTDTIHIVVNNAALAAMQYNKPLFNLTPELFDDMFHANVRAPVFVFRAVWDHLPPRGGRILNISSLASKRDCVDPLITYGATKAALDSYTRSMGKQFGRQKTVTINSVSVGPTETDALIDARGTLPEAYVDAMKEYATAERRFGTPYDIAAIVSFLASDDAKWINGSSIPANGGAINIREG